MKKFLSLAACSLMLVAASNAQTEKTPYLTKSLSGESIKNVKVETSGGSISVTGGSEARIDVYVTPNNGKENLSKEEIKQRLEEKYDVVINISNGKLEATAKPKERKMDWKKALSISFKVFVPQSVSTELHTSGGSISLNNLSGNQDFSTSGGSLAIDKVTGKIHGRTSGGSIDIEDSKSEIDLNTSGGSITAKNCEGTIKLRTSGGSLSLNDLNGTISANTSGGSVGGKNIKGELEAHTSGGNIHFNDLYCSLETSTSGGNIDIAFKEIGKFIKVSNSGGNIALEIPKGKGLDLKLEANSIKTDKLENFSGNLDDDEISGKLNGGGVSVKVHAGSGRISLALK
ncbi:MAG: DUF4097 family beta strand repeat-containing protein [Flavisolibacter sp.]